jgi:hypothetical protein
MTDDEIHQTAYEVIGSLADLILALRAAYEGEMDLVEIMGDDPLWGMPDGYLEAFELWLRMNADEHLSEIAEKD